MPKGKSTGGGGGSKGNTRALRVKKVNPLKSLPNYRKSNPRRKMK